jgi:hypothetical protein
MHQEMRKIDSREQMTVFMKNHDSKVEDEKTDPCVAQCFFALIKERFCNFFFNVSPLCEHFEAEEQEIVPPVKQQEAIECGHVQQDGI